LRAGPVARLKAVKVAHTLVWALFAGCIVAIPWFAWKMERKVALVLIASVSCEVGILLANHMHCPLTPIAARYTDDRRDNFDICLPEWLARCNKLIFGTLFVLGCAYTLIQWSRT
jgi:hypothetical protein